MPPVRINNRDPRLDINGDIVDAHDGSLEYFAGRFYWYGTAYGETNGFTEANIFRVYSSPDLTRWTPHGNILPDHAPGVFYRPYVKYCAAYVWTGDRWGSRLDGIKGHDFQFWSAPLEFSEAGAIAPLKWVSEWSFEGAD